MYTTSETTFSPETFATCLSYNKVHQPHSAVKSYLTTSSLHIQPGQAPVNLTVLSSVSGEELSQIINKSVNTFMNFILYLHLI